MLPYEGNNLSKEEAGNESVLGKRSQDNSIDSMRPPKKRQNVNGTTGY